MRLGTWLAVMYAVPRQSAPTLCEKTRVRTSPSIRDSEVRPAISTAPCAMLAAWPVTRPADGLCSGLTDSPAAGLAGAGFVTPASLVCTKPALFCDRQRRGDLGRQRIHPDSTSARCTLPAQCGQRALYL